MSFTARPRRDGVKQGPQQGPRLKLVRRSISSFFRRLYRGANQNKLDLRTFHLSLVSAQSIIHFIICITAQGKKMTFDALYIKS